ncbi:MAG: hypothetical protein CMK59_14855 [Proteobacteria bacterium]|nr:hypothetical protein [Pseudomonadota bacterium]
MLSIFLFSSAFAVPLQLTQQGRILDPSGAPVEGLTPVTFRIYDAQTNGQLLWDETLSVQFNNGYYAAILGIDEQNNPLNSNTLSMYPLFIELQIDSNAPMNPRLSINSAPYAQIAGVSESVQGGIVSGSEIQIQGQQVINSASEWVGSPISSDWNTLVNIPADIADGDDNTNLTESDVEQLISNDPIDLSAGSTVNQSLILTQADAITPDWNDIQNRPPGLDDGDDNTNLTESDVEQLISNDPIDLSAGSTMNSQPLMTAPTCGNGEILVYDLGLGTWSCGIDSDTTLTAAEVQAMIEAVSGLALQAGATMNGHPLLSTDSVINPNQLDTSAASAGQNLIYDGNTVQWSNSGAGCSIVESVESNHAYVVLECPSSSHVLRGSSTTVSSFAKSGSYVNTGHCIITPLNEVVCWSDNANLNNPPAGTFVDLAQGSQYACAIDSSGSLSCWGYDGYGIDSPPSGTFTQVQSGENHACAIKDDQTVLCWGHDNDNQVSGAPSADTFLSLELGERHSCGILTNNGARCWGYSYNGLTNPPSDSFKELFSGNFFSCGITTVDTIKCWGKDNDNQVSGAPSGTFSQLALGESHGCALATSGDVSCWGADFESQVSDTPSGTFSKITAGEYHTCGLRTSGEVECWGYSTGINGTPSNTVFTDIVSNVLSNCGRLSSGNVLCWGQNNAQIYPP